ncbi:MAG: TGS domain-containing protein [Candidatus Kryptoniota bacterium]
MPRVKLQDMSTLEVDSTTPVIEIAKKISRSLAEEALVVKIDGKLSDINTPITTDCEIKFLTFDDPEGKEVYWHSSSHLMAHAIQSLFPEAKFGVGPAIEEGFYYDIDIDKTLTPADLEAIEKKMHEIAGKDNPFVRKVVEKEAALVFFKEKDDPYKLEIITALDGVISFYSEGEFTDLCRGPHVPSAGKLKYFKLLGTSGAYWRGDSKNKMLQRVYGVSFPKKKMLEDHLKMLEEAKLRDHRRLGRDLELFVFHDISPGAPFWLPKGMVIFREL